jgi:hypothetical protein
MMNTMNRLNIMDSLISLNTSNTLNLVTWNSISNNRGVIRGKKQWISHSPMEVRGGQKTLERKSELGLGKINLEL